ncbi:MAG TPA: hypothetical protein VKY24_23990 [Reyranella sp.]|nr:hypothetical protein [Reyranella sp.]
MTKSVMDYTAIVEAGALIKAHCRKDASGFAVYEDGWSDERVQQELGANAASVANIVGLRRKLIGNTRRTTTATDAAQEKRIEELEGRVAELETAMSGTMQWLQRRFQYQPPPGRPRSSPPGLNGTDAKAGP